MAYPREVWLTRTRKHSSPVQTVKITAYLVLKLRSSRATQSDQRIFLDANRRPRCVHGVTSTRNGAIERDVEKVRPGIRELGTGGGTKLLRQRSSRCLLVLNERTRANKRVQNVCNCRVRPSIFFVPVPFPHPPVCCLLETLFWLSTKASESFYSERERSASRNNRERCVCAAEKFARRGRANRGGRTIDKF